MNFLQFDSDKMYLSYFVFLVQKHMNKLCLIEKQVWHIQNYIHKYFYLNPKNHWEWNWAWSPRMSQAHTPGHFKQAPPNWPRPVKSPGARWCRMFGPQTEP